MLSLESRDEQCFLIEVFYCGSIKVICFSNRTRTDKREKSNNWARGFNLWKKRKSSSTSSSDETITTDGEYDSKPKGFDFRAIVTLATRNKKQLAT